MTSRILGSIGRFFITTGIVILLFVAYQLWGTGIQEAAAQGDLGNDFDELLDSVDPLAEATTTTTTTSTTTTSVAPGETTTTTTTTIAPAGGTIPVFEAELADKLFREGGEAVARMNIPKIGVTKYVVQGVKVEDLRNGPGHYRATVFPGQEGNSGVAGHRTTYGAPFNQIAAEKLGTLSDFRVPEGQEQLGHIIVRPEATWVLGDFGDNRITLTACHPKYSARERIIVAAELVSTPVDAPPPPEDYAVVDQVELPTEELLAEATGEGAVDSEIVAAPVDADVEDDDDESGSATAVATDEVSLDEGLNGDKTALRPALLWGAMAILLYLFFKELARGWKFWPAVLIGIVPVAFFMALSFEKIDRYLPAG